MVAVRVDREGVGLRAAGDAHDRFALGEHRHLAGDRAGQGADDQLAHARRFPSRVRAIGGLDIGEADQAAIGVDTRRYGAQMGRRDPVAWIGRHEVGPTGRSAGVGANEHLSHALGARPVRRDREDHAVAVHRDVVPVQRPGLARSPIECCERLGQHGPRFAGEPADMDRSRVRRRLPGHRERGAVAIDRAQRAERRRGKAGRERAGRDLHPVRAVMARGEQGRGARLLRRPHDHGARIERYEVELVGVGRGRQGAVAGQRLPAVEAVPADDANRRARNGRFAEGDHGRSVGADRDARLARCVRARADAAVGRAAAELYPTVAG